MITFIHRCLKDFISICLYIVSQALTQVSEPDPLGSYTFGKSRSDAKLNDLVAFQVNGALKPESPPRPVDVIYGRHNVEGSGDLELGSWLFLASSGFYSLSLQKNKTRKESPISAEH